MTKLLTVNDISRFSATAVLNDKFMRVEKQLGRARWCSRGLCDCSLRTNDPEKITLTAAIRAHIPKFSSDFFFFFYTFTYPPPIPIYFEMFYNTVVQVPFLLFEWVYCPFEINGRVKNWVTAS